MDNSINISLREFLQECLIEAGDRNSFTDDSSLFISGRLDSLAMTRVVMFLEDSFRIDFGKLDFDVEMIDTLNDIQALVDAESARMQEAKRA